MHANKRKVGSFPCSHCLCLMKAGKILRHMQFEHGLCFPQRLLIQSSIMKDYVLCPVCPKTKVKWWNLERHFVKIHTKDPDKIELNCSGCGAISVRLKNVYKHQICMNTIQFINSKERGFQSVFPSTHHKLDGLQFSASSPSTP